jgi:triosephosphate isomerase
MQIFANYKSYLDFAETNILVHQLLQSDAILNSQHSFVLFPSVLAFTEVEQALRESDIDVGMQAIGPADGAYTGTIAAEQATAAGATYTLVGHSERRHRLGETDAMVAEQFTAALSAALIPVLCVGETAAELEAGTRNERIAEQLKVLTDISEDAAFVVAYEPVWAIAGSGNGQVCDPAETDTMHSLIKQLISDYTSMQVPVLFGGSVNAKNVVSYTSLSTVDGILVGSASTKVESFEALAQAVA